MIDVDRERWRRLSPPLDGLLDLEPQSRAARLEALRREGSKPELFSKDADLVRSETNRLGRIVRDAHVALE
ncbi:MAG: hypothetical protein ABI330_17060 [Caldimonas sp.]|nr:hypothetical protein [Pseudomonadota bacterium]